MGFKKNLIFILWIVSVKAGSRLLGFNFKDVSPVGEKGCFKLCHRYADCLSINFSRTRLLCELNSEQASNITMVTENSAEAEDFIYTPRQSIPQDVIFQMGACSNVSCPAKHVCVAVKSGTATCVITRCSGEPDPVYYGKTDPLPANRTSNGSFAIGTRAIGESIYYTCAPGTIPVGGNSVKCLASGKWDTPKFSCQVCIEPDDPKGLNYWGTVNVTVNGNECQRWEKQWPHGHNMPNGTERKNYCRNPDGEPGPWCYTVLPSVRWELCPVPTC